MDKILRFFSQYGLNFHTLLWTIGITLVGSILMSAIGRFVFGKRSSLSVATSSAIGILFVYVLNIVLFSAGAKFQNLVTPLPFITYEGNSVVLFQLSGASFTAICSQLVSLILLSFLMNVIDRFLPRGKHLFTWVIYRSCAVIGAQISFILITLLFEILLPVDILTYAPMIILGVLLFMLLTGALKIVVGLFLTTVNPLIAALYTFFFANILGKQVTRAVFTTAILTGLVYLFSNIGITAISLAAGALFAYIPFLLLLLVLWYLLNKLF